MWALYWINMKAEEAVKWYPICLDHQTTWPKDKVMSHKIPERLWECVRADIWTINNKHCLCAVNYHSKFPVVNQVERFSAEYLIKHARWSFQNKGSPVRWFQMQAQTLFHKNLKTLQKSSVYDMQYQHHTHTKAMDRQKCAFNSHREQWKKCYGTNTDINMTLLQVGQQA